MGDSLTWGVSEEELKKRIEQMFRPVDKTARTKGVRPEVTYNLARLELDILDSWISLSSEMKSEIKQYFSVDETSVPMRIGLSRPFSHAAETESSLKAANSS